MLLRVLTVSLFIFRKIFPKGQSCYVISLSWGNTHGTEQVYKQRCCLVFGRWLVRVSDRIAVILTDALRDFPQSLQTNATIVSQIRPRTIPSRSFTIHHSLIYSFHVV
jgi:hypothetical protein